MNRPLTQEIINHIFSGFGVLESSNFNNKFKSLNSSDYLLSEKISIQDDTGHTLKNNIWGIQFTIEGNLVKVLLANCSVDSNVIEYAMIINAPNSPSYGVYSAYSLDKSAIDSCPMIAVSVDSRNWMQCNTYFQATFLAAMESLKDLTYAPSYCSDYKEQYNLLLSFVKYHNNIYGDAIEG